MAKDSRPYYAWANGKEAKRLGWSREVPEFWKDQAGEWLRGYDGEPAPE